MGGPGGRRKVGERGNRSRRKRKRETEVPQVGEEEGQNLSAPVGECPPRRKAWTCLAFPPPGCTCCCRESMETYLITIMGCTCTGETGTTLCGSVVGSG